MQTELLNPYSVITCRSVARSAFTLIELLVVIGVIALVAGVLGLGFSGTGGTVALQGGQATVSSLVNAARGKAAIAGNNAAVVVWGDPDDADTFLRKLAVFVEVETDIWQQRGDAFYLPSGIYIVPPEADENSDRAKLEPDDNDWIDVGFDARSLAANADSASTGDPSLSVRESGATVGSSNEALYLLLNVTPLGRLGGPSPRPNRIVLAPGQRESAELIVFREPESVIGVTLSTYGITTLVNEKEAFTD